MRREREKMRLTEMRRNEIYCPQEKAWPLRITMTQMIAITQRMKGRKRRKENLSEDTQEKDSGTAKADLTPVIVSPVTRVGITDKSTDNRKSFSSAEIVTR